MHLMRLAELVGAACFVLGNGSPRRALAVQWSAKTCIAIERNSRYSTLTSVQWRFLTGKLSLCFHFYGSASPQASWVLMLGFRRGQKFKCFQLIFNLVSGVNICSCAYHIIFSVFPYSTATTWLEEWKYWPRFSSKNVGRNFQKTEDSWKHLGGWRFRVSYQFRGEVFLSAPGNLSFLVPHQSKSSYSGSGCLCFVCLFPLTISFSLPYLRLIA